MHRLKNRGNVGIERLQLKKIQWIVDATNKVLYHVAREGKQRYEVEDKIRFPFSPPRDYSKWPQYKQEAEELLETERKEKWSDYPSRNDCLFVSADEESAKEWARSIFSQNTLLYIYTIKAINGKIVFLDTDWFEGLGELLSKKKQFITHNHSKNVYQHIGAVVRWEKVHYLKVFFMEKQSFLKR